jgi:hypothetical protein
MGGVFLMITIIRLNDYPIKRKKRNIVIMTIQRKITNFAPNFTNTQSYGIKIKIQGR